MKQAVVIPRLKKKRLIGSFLALAAIFAACLSGYYFYESGKIHEAAARNIQAIADLKVSQLSQWRRERYGDARTMFQSPFLTQALRTWLNHPADTMLRQKIMQQFAAVKNEYGYYDIFIASTNGDLLLNARATRETIGREEQSEIDEAKNHSQVFVRDFFRSSIDQKIYFDIIAPLRDSQNRQTIAVLVFRTDPDDFLYPLIETWPFPSLTSESLLLRKEGDSVLYLNDLRFREHTALQLKVPLSRTDLPAVQAALGTTGIFNGYDYRGVHVLAYLTHVPNTPWAMVSKVDYQEIFAELTYRSIVISMFGGIMIILLAAIYIAFSRHTRLKESERELARETERRNAEREGEKQIRRSEERFRTLVEHASDGIFMTDAEGHIMDVNPKGASMLGYTHEELIGRIMNDLYYDLGSTSPQTDVGGHSIEERRMIRKDGTLLPVEFSRNILEGGGMIKVIRDITQRKQMEEKLVAREKEYTTLVEQLDEGFVVLELIYDEAGEPFDFRFIEVNQAYERQTGLTNVVGRTIRDVMSDYDAGRLAVFAQVAREGKPIRAEVSAIGRKYNFFAYRIGPEGSNKVGVIFNDITERLEMEELMRDLQRREAVGVLSAGIAHDFNNLLSVMMGNVSLAQLNLPQNHPAASNMDKALSAMETAADLTRQMLAYAGKGQFQHVTIDLKQEIQTHAALFHVSIPKNVKLETNLPPSPVYVDGDPAQLKQVVMNLIINGADAIGEAQGTVTVSLSAGVWNAERLAPYTKQTNISLTEGPYALIEVADTGSGMSEQTIPKIFDPFFTTKFVGRGLGLSAVLGIIRSMKGGIAVESELGKGSVFRVVLPASRDASNKMKAEEQQAILQKEEGKTILVIDDEKDVASMAQELLEAGGYSVIIETNPLHGIELYRQRKAEIGLVLLDLTMPEMPGERVASILLEINPEARIIIASGYSATEVSKRLGSQRVTGVIHKPYHMEALLSLVNTRILPDGNVSASLPKIVGEEYESLDHRSDLRSENDTSAFEARRPSDARASEG